MNYVICAVCGTKQLLMLIFGLPLTNYIVCFLHYDKIAGKPIYRHLQFLGDIITHMDVCVSPFTHKALSLSTRWILSHRRGIIKLKSIQELQR